MEKIIMRNKAVHARSNYIDRRPDLCGDDSPDTLLNIVYQEDISYEELSAEYTKMLNGEKSSLFIPAYRVTEDCAVVLDEHITLYRLSRRTDEKCEIQIPWAYYTLSKYLGDTWWFNDEEILRDLEEMNSVDFLTKYRGI